MFLHVCDLIACALEIFMCRPIGTHLTACVAMGIPRDVFNASVLGYQSLSTEKCFCMCNWDIHA